mmetsp:Transcript_86313/g.277063  ORF Transcript_86313/g.277063 Transcript_86313/m.277063 type:complete len:91 (-) Transcript_86313:184-456(-)
MPSLAQHTHSMSVSCHPVEASATQRSSSATGPSQSDAASRLLVSRMLARVVSRPGLWEALVVDELSRMHAEAGCPKTSIGLPRSRVRLGR